MTSKVSLTRLVDQALCDPEVGAVNFNHLRTLLLAIIKLTNIENGTVDKAEKVLKRKSGELNSSRADEGIVLPPEHSNHNTISNGSVSTVSANDQALGDSNQSNTVTYNESNREPSVDQNNNTVSLDENRTVHANVTDVDNNTTHNNVTSGGVTGATGEDGSSFKRDRQGSSRNSQRVGSANKERAGSARNRDRPTSSSLKKRASAISSQEGKVSAIEHLEFRNVCLCRTTK